MAGKCSGAVESVRGAGVIDGTLARRCHCQDPVPVSEIRRSDRIRDSRLVAALSSWLTLASACSEEARPGERADAGGSLTTSVPPSEPGGGGAPGVSAPNMASLPAAPSTEVAPSASPPGAAGGGPGCDGAAHYLCDGNAVVAFDPCTSRLAEVERCDGECHEGRCVPCVPLSGVICVEGAIHQFGCGDVGALVERCDLDCVAGRCVESQDCSDGDCTECSDPGAADCPPCEPRPVGTQCINGSIHRLLGGCDEEVVPERTPLETCAFGCNAGTCLDSECIPSAGRTCQNGNVHSVDSCGDVGALVASCAHGCDQGACAELMDAGTPGDDAGPEPRDAGAEPTDAAPLLDADVGDEVTAPPPTPILLSR